MKDALKEKLNEMYPDEKILEIAKMIDMDFTVNGIFFGLDSLCEYLDDAADSANEMQMMTTGKERVEHQMAWGAYATLSHIFREAGEMAYEIMKREAKKRAERN